MIRKSIAVVLVTVLFTMPNANAVLWQIGPTTQNGTPGAAGFGAGTDGMGTGAPTLGLVGWFEISRNGLFNDGIYAQGTAPGYACYGLTVSGNTTCADAGTPVIWDPNPAVFSGSVNDDGSFLNLSWTGQVGTAVPFVTGSLFTNSILSGSYDANGNISGGVDAGAGYDVDGFSCWNNPANGLPGPPDFCGNGTGVTTTVPPGGGRTITNLFLPLGITLFTDNGDGTFTIDMNSSTYTDCVNDAGCTPGDNTQDIFAQWRLNASCATADGKCCGGVDTDPCPPMVPIPAAVWLFGSALGLLGWMRRKLA